MYNNTEIFLMFGTFRRNGKQRYVKKLNFLHKKS